MTEQELKDEWMYRYLERLGHLCPEGEPTNDQINLARSEANAGMKALMAHHFPPKWEDEFEKMRKAAGYPKKKDP